MSVRQIAADDPLFATVGSRIRAVRMAKGLTGEKVAKRLKIVRPTLVHWEANNVVNIPADRIEEFAKMTGVSAAWLRHREGNPPKLDFSKATKFRPRPIYSEPETKLPPLAEPEPFPAPTVNPIEPGADPSSATAVIAEIKPRLSAHAREIDVTPQASWSIPREVMTLGFNCDPVHGFIHRAAKSEPAMPDGTPVNRGDYILIDPTRNAIDEPGLYYVADPDGVEAQRVVVTMDEGRLIAKSHRTGDTVSIEDLRVLGRTMAVFHAL